MQFAELSQWAKSVLQPSSGQLVYYGCSNSLSLEIQIMYSLVELPTGEKLKRYYCTLLQPCNMNINGEHCQSAKRWIMMQTVQGNKWQYTNWDIHVMAAMWILIRTIACYCMAWAKAQQQSHTCLWHLELQLQNHAVCCKHLRTYEWLQPKSQLANVNNC